MAVVQCTVEKKPDFRQEVAKNLNIWCSRANEILFY